MAERRRYTKREKVTAVLAADMTSQEAAAEATGIPRTTIRYWLSDPELAELRHNARAGMAEEALVVARLAWGKLAEAIRNGKLDAEQLLTAVGIATDKATLLSGGATSRHETRDLTANLDDHERDALADAIDAWLAGRTDTTVGEPAVGTGAEVRQ
jgi:hypothetical protein